MRSSNLAQIEHRWGRRIPCSAPVRLLTPTLSASARLRDLSSSGAFIETILQPPAGTPLTLAILREDGSRREQELRAIVVRVVTDGLAVEWCETPAGPVCPVLGCTTLCAAARE
jgi:hypothetical protein